MKIQWINQLDLTDKLPTYLIIIILLNLVLISFSTKFKGDDIMVSSKHFYSCYFEDGLISVR